MTILVSFFQFRCWPHFDHFGNSSVKRWCSFGYLDASQSVARFEKRVARGWVIARDPPEDRLDPHARCRSRVCEQMHAPMRRTEGRLGPDKPTKFRNFIRTCLKFSVNSEDLEDTLTLVIFLQFFSIFKFSTFFIN